jgi:predicted ABC-class ATPase
VQFDLPNYGTIKGMGIPEGVTLIVGGGYHGKSTLLKAIELGIYDHIPGDGREFAVTVPEAVKIRAADGRSIVKTDISPFIKGLPFGKDTACFSTENASGSTSQAANITEAVEAGARLLLIDEDTAATNFMIRDHRMQQLVSRDEEPITPFVDKVRQLYTDHTISTILVMGGSGDYFSVADHVIQMKEYQPYDVSDKARLLAKRIVTGRINEGGETFGQVRNRIPERKGIDANLLFNQKISGARTDEIVFGNTKIDLKDVEQLVDISQTRALGHAIRYALKFIDGNRTLSEIADLLLSSIRNNGLEIVLPFLTGDIAAFRRFEFIAALNRMRTLQIKHKQ